MPISVTPIPILSGLEAPSFTLGTSNVLGTALTAVPSNSTLLAFDATLPDAITFGQSGSAGSATVTARRDHAHAMATVPAVTSLVASGNTTVGANTKFGINIGAAEAGPLLYIYDAWIAVNDIGVTQGPDWHVDETLAVGVGTFINRYAQTAGTTQSNLVVVNGSTTSRTVQYRLYELAT